MNKKLEIFIDLFFKKLKGYKSKKIKLEKQELSSFINILLNKS